MKRKKNAVFTFICSFMPGAAEMYMGFMRMGVSLMGVFFLSVLIPSVLRIDDVFVMVAALVWFYGFFHARNLVYFDDEQFESLADVYIWEEFTGEREHRVSDQGVRKWGAGALIVCGVVMLWKNFAKIAYDFIPEDEWETVFPIIDSIPQSVIAGLLIGLGVRLIMGKKEEVDKQMVGFNEGDSQERMLADKKEEVADGEGK